MNEVLLLIERRLFRWRWQVNCDRACEREIQAAAPAGRSQESVEVVPTSRIAMEICWCTTAAASRCSENEFLCICGPSGCGKTTLLDILAGILAVAGPNVLIDGSPSIRNATTSPSCFRSHRRFPGSPCGTTSPPDCGSRSTPARGDPAHSVDDIIDHRRTARTSNITIRTRSPAG